MDQLNLLLLHVEQQARAEYNFDLQPTANISLFFLPFGVFTVSLHIFWINYFCFLLNKSFSKSNKFVFQVR